MSFAEWFEELAAKNIHHEAAPHVTVPLDQSRPTGTLAESIKWGSQVQPAAVAQPPAEPKKESHVSVLTTIKVDVEKFFKSTGSDAEKFAKAFITLFKKAPSALQTVENFTSEVALVLITATEIVDPVAEPAVAGALEIVQTGLAGIQASAAAANSGQSLLVNLTNFSSTVPNLLGSLDIKNPVLKSTVGHIVNVVVAECKVLIPAVTSWVSQIKAAQTPTQAA